MKTVYLGNRSLRWFAFLVLTSAGLMLASAGMPAAAHAETTVGTITQLSGTAQIERAGITSNAAVALPVQLHDKITTGSGSQLTIGLVDNGSLTLSPSSTMMLDDSALVNGVAAPTKVGLIGGTLRAIILGDLRGAGGGFEIHTPNAIGAVRGTDVTVHYTNSVPPTP
ncbi:MAG TPA: FecR domain-containing protein [Candidatus Binataceae bacterium]